MTDEEQGLLEHYLTQLNILGEDGLGAPTSIRRAPSWERTEHYLTHSDFEAWYQEVRYARGPSAPRTLEEAAELRYKDILDAARLFNQLQELSNYLKVEHD